MCWVYILKNKYEAFETFKKFHAWIENNTWYHIGSTRTDNGNNILQSNIKFGQSKIKFGTILNIGNVMKGPCDWCVLMVVGFDGATGMVLWWTVELQSPLTSTLV